MSFLWKKILESLALYDMEEETNQKEIASENTDKELNLDDLSLDEDQEENDASEQTTANHIEEKMKMSKLWK